MLLRDLSPPVITPENKNAHRSVSPAATLQKGTARKEALGWLTAAITSGITVDYGKGGGRAGEGSQLALGGILLEMLLPSDGLTRALCYSS